MTAAARAKAAASAIITEVELVKAALMYMFCGGCTCVLIMTTPRPAIVGDEARSGKVDASV